MGVEVPSPPILVCLAGAYMRFRHALLGEDPIGVGTWCQ